MSGARDAAAWVARMVAVEEGAIRAHHLAEDLASMDADVLVLLLAEVQEQTARGDKDAGRFMMALQEVLTDALLPYERLVILYKAAANEGLHSVQRLLLAPPPRRAERKRVPKKPPEGPDTLGMRTWQARTAVGQQLERLCRDDDARVIRNVLLNPRVTEREVLRIATRRPVQVPILLEVARSQRWNRRASIRRALVFNPYTPTEVALRLLPFLGRTDLLQLGGDSRVHEEVARQAAHFATLRPPQLKAAQRASGLPGTEDAYNEDEEV